MGLGIDLARPGAPLHTAVLDSIKDQLIIALVQRLGGSVDFTVEQFDAVGSSLLLMSVEGRTIHFETREKQ